MYNLGERTVRAHILAMVLALSIFAPMVLVPVRSAPSHINGHTQMGTVFVDILDVNVSHNATYLGATISVHVTVEITWDVFDFSSGYVDTLYDGNLIERKIFYVIWQGHTIDYLVFDWNTSGVEMGSHSISAVAVGTNIDICTDGTVQILPVGNLNTKGGYQTIQEAINDANDGDTIFVRNGTYYENVVLNKTVSLIGESRTTTIIDGNGTGNVMSLNAYAYDAKIAGFTICNGDYGIVLWSSHNNTISDNIIVNNGWLGIWANYCENNVLSRNIITNNQGGVCVFYPGNNTLNNNYIANNSDFGIYLHASHNNKIIANDVAANGKGIYIEGMYIGYSSGDNHLCHNNIVNNTNQFLISSSPNNTWDNGCEGNYCSDYNGTDSNGDGIGDTQYAIDANNTDKYPLMNMYWNPSDINHDLKIDIKDVARAAMAYGTQPIDPLWNPHADITGPEYLVPDNKVDIRDVSLIARHFGETEG